MPPLRSTQKVTANGNSLTITLPRPMLHALGWAKGTAIILEQRDGCIVVAGLEAALTNTILQRIETERYAPVRPPL